MSKRNDDFFVQKNPWSEVKDELLGCYFKPYVAKILHTYKPLFYVDCFAGKGKFDDGKRGSPLIALDIISDCLQSTQMEDAKIQTCFIELNHAEALKKNLDGYENTYIISGKYETTIENLLQNKQGYNVFLYIDPYGIKALNCTLFDKFANYNFNSIELLINLNSFGFMREACRTLGANYNDVGELNDLIEYEPTRLDTSTGSINDLNTIAGGKYWQNIVDDYKKGKIDGYDAEARFSNEYCRRLMQSYKYVLNMPLRIKQGQRPKYRMIYATNHEDGCILMNDNICKRWEALREIQTCGQQSFFVENVENQTIDSIDIQSKLVEHLKQYTEFESINRILATFFTTYGTICSSADIRELFTKLESQEKISVQRTPSFTKAGKKSKFFTQNTKQSVLIRSNL
jgi:three-Cys-motif partner protein